MIRIGVVAFVVILLTAATIGAVLMIRSLAAGKDVAFLSDVIGLKNSYYVGDEQEVDGTMRATYKDGRVEVVPITEDMVTGFDSSEPGRISVTLSYKNASVDVPVTFAPLKVRSLSIDESTRPSVVYAGVPFPAGMYLDAEMIDGTQNHVPVTSSMIKGFDELLLGTQKVTVTYHNASVTLTVEVKADEVDQVQVLTEKTVYERGEAPDLDDLLLLFKNKSGLTRTVKVTEAMLSAPIDTTQSGAHSVTVTHSGYVATYNYTVN